MAASPDHPDLQFVQAKGYTPGRPYGKPIWVVWHDMEAFETDDRAERTALYFANPGDGRNVSAHYCWDRNSGVQCVRLHDSAWTVGNREGNYLGINHELAGFASQSRAQWLDDFGRGMFAELAPTVRADMAEYGIPLRRCTQADLLARRPGHTSHDDLRKAFGGTTHTDPGPNFPWDILFAVIAGGPLPGEDTVQGLFRYTDDPVPNRVWLGDRMIKREVTPDQLVDDPTNTAFLQRVINGTDPANGPIVDISGLVGGPLSNSARVYQTAGFLVTRGNAWGATYPPAVDISDPAEHSHPVDLMAAPTRVIGQTGPAQPA